MRYRLLVALQHQLERWVNAGLIDASQAERILAHETQRGRPRLQYAIVGLGGLAIAIGIVSIIAANWGAIPAWLKIAVDLVLVAGLSAAVYRLDRRGPGWGRDVAILILYGLILASIALVGQIYQLGGEARIALTTWTLLTAMLMTRARSGIVAFLWLAGIQTTYATWVYWFGEGDARRSQGLALGAIYWLPLVCLIVGRLKLVLRARAALASVFASVGWVQVVLAASLGSFAFYTDSNDDIRGGLLVALLVSIVLTGWLVVTLNGEPQARPRQVLLVLCLGLAYVPLLLSDGNLDSLGALLFIGLWLWIAYVAYRLDDARLLNLATAVVGVRLLFVYFEVFGSLLGTGIGLVVGGLLTLGLVALWMRLRRHLAQEGD